MADRFNRLGPKMTRGSFVVSAVSFSWVCLLRNRLRAGEGRGKRYLNKMPFQ